MKDMNIANLAYATLHGDHAIVNMSIGHCLFPNTYPLQSPTHGRVFGTVRVHLMDGDARIANEGGWGSETGVFCPV